MTKERLELAFSIATEQAMKKCTNEKNIKKPDFSRYSLRQLILLLKKEVLELDDAFTNGVLREVVDEAVDVYAFSSFIIAKIQEHNR